jgi:peptidoglycan/LPS O-acetylase OafA/YrhL
LDKDFSGSINPPFWSIAVEVQLYLVYPLLWLYARRFGWNVALVTTMLVEFTLRGASVVCSLQHPAIEPPQWLVVNPFSFWFTWCLGAALADFYLRKTIPAIGRSQAWALCALALASYFFKPTYFFTFTLVAVATAAWICAHLQSTRAPRPSSRVLRMLSASGLVSYSLYLIHQPILNLATPLTAIVSPHYYHPLLLALVGIALYVPTYYVACAIYRFVELPSIAIGKSFLQRSRAEVQQPVVWPEISESGQGAGAARRRNLRG